MCRQFGLSDKLRLLQLVGGLLVIAILLVIAGFVLQALSEAYAPVFRILSRF